MTSKQRDIAFCELHPDQDQAASAALALADIPGMLEVAALTPRLLRVRYDLFELSLREIEGLLTEVGFHLAGDLIHRLKRALINYSEEVQRANLGTRPRQDNRDDTRKVFIERYHRLNHDCQDKRPAIWRDYR